MKRDCPFCHSEIKFLKKISGTLIGECAAYDVYKVYVCTKCNKKYLNVPKFSEFDHFYTSGKGVIYNLSYSRWDSENLFIKDFSSHNVNEEKIDFINLEDDNNLKCHLYEKEIFECDNCKKKVDNSLLQIYDANGFPKYHSVPYCKECQLYFLKEEQYKNCVPKITLIGKGLIIIDKDIFRNKNDIVPSNTKDIRRPEVANRRKQTIEFKDFLVRQTIMQCVNNEHKIEDILGVISYIDAFDEERTATVQAGYCEKCDLFFIMENTYQHIKKKGLLLCRIFDEKEYHSHGKFCNKELKPKSILKQYGYSVNALENLSDIRRQAILSLLIDNGILTKLRIIEHLDWCMRIRDNLEDRDLSSAFSKWRRDIRFVEHYKEGKYTKFGINSIKRL